MGGSRVIRNNSQDGKTMTNTLRQFLGGMGSVLDLGAGSVQADVTVGRGLDLGRTNAEALSRDWQKLSHDFHTAFNQTLGDAAHGKPQ
jgi:hypothetical protein